MLQLGLYVLWLWSPGQSFELGAGAARKPRPGDEVVGRELFLPNDALKGKVEDAEVKVNKFQDAPCWREAKARLVATKCESTNHDAKSRIALALANCHMERAGMFKTLPLCPDDAPLGSCFLTETHALRSEQFHAYTEFFNHLDNICFFVRREAFQEDTERAVHRLYSATLETSDHLNTFAQDALNVKEQMLHALTQQQTDLNAYMDNFQQKQVEQFGMLSETTTKLGSKQDAMVSTLEQKTKSLQSVLEQSVDIQQQVKSTQAGLLEQFGKANYTLQRLENRQEDALALVQNTTEDLRRLSDSQQAAFDQTSSSLSMIQGRQQAIDQGISRAVDAANKFTDEQTKLFQLLFTQANQLKSGQESLLGVVGSTKSSLDELSSQQKLAFEGSVSRLEQLEKSTVSYATDISVKLAESTQSQERAFQTANEGFALISSMQDQVNDKQHQLLQTLMGTHDRLGRMQEQSESSYREASQHLLSIQEQSQQAEERVHKAMAGLQGQIEDNFKRVLSLDSSILTELFTIKSFVFYASCAVVTFFCTSSRQTQRVRPHLFAMLLLTCYLEGQVAHLLEWLPHGSVVLVVRKLLVASACVVLAFSAWRFKDFHELSYAAAMENQEILRSVVLHLQKRALVDNFGDTTDLDRFQPALVRMLPQVKLNTPKNSTQISSSDKDEQKHEESPKKQEDLTSADERKEGELEGPVEGQTPAEPAGLMSPMRCTAQLKKGGQCSRRATTNSKCYLHRDTDSG